MEKDLEENTLIRYMKAVKKRTNLAIANDWMNKIYCYLIYIIDGIYSFCQQI